MSSTQTEQSLGAMVAGVTEDLSALVREQVALTKAEVRQSAQVAAGSAGMLAAAAVLGLFAFLFLLLTIAYVLIQLGLAAWAAFGIVTLVLLIVTAILALVGAKRMRTVKGPERSKVQLQETRALLSRRG